MRRQKKIKKIKLPYLLEGLREAIFKRVVSALAVILFFAILLVLAKTFLHRSDSFLLRVVEMRDMSTKRNLASPAAGELLKLYKYKNIFEIDIRAIAKSLEVSYPDAKDIIVRRAFPDKLVIDLNPRKPVALVGDTKHCAVDEDGFLIMNADIRLSKGLPVITGVDIRVLPTQGKRGPLDSKNLKAALSLLKEMKRSGFSREYNVNMIDAGDISNMTFYLMNGLEVRIGSENFKERLAVFRKMIRDPRFIVDKIKYIDLRFKDVVVAPK